MIFILLRYPEFRVAATSVVVSSTHSIPFVKMNGDDPVQQHFWGRAAQAASSTRLEQSNPTTEGASNEVRPSSEDIPSRKVSQEEYEESVFSMHAPKGTPITLFGRTAEEKKTREVYEDMSTMFSIITTTERLENIQTRYHNLISAEAYEKHCRQLVHLYNTLHTAAEDTIPRLDKFMAQYELRAGKARLRLKHGFEPVEPVRPEDESKFVFRATTLFHCVGNCIDMDQLAVGMLLPDLITLMKTLQRIASLGEDFGFLPTLKNWVEKLNSMPAAEELEIEDAKQLKLDLDNGYAEFDSAISD